MSITEASNCYDIWATTLRKSKVGELLVGVTVFPSSDDIRAMGSIGGVAVLALLPCTVSKRSTEGVWSVLQCYLEVVLVVYKYSRIHMVRSS